MFQTQVKIFEFVFSIYSMFQTQENKYLNLLCKFQLDSPVLYYASTVIRSS